MDYKYGQAAENHTISFHMTEECEEERDTKVGK
jgi:hypothetical protein